MENEKPAYAHPMMREDALKGKTIVITGGGTGLGRAMGTYFLKLGANLVITSRKLDVLENKSNVKIKFEEYNPELNN